MTCYMKNGPAVLCIQCNKAVIPRVVTGKVIYKTTPTIAKWQKERLFFQCKTCKNYLTAKQTPEGKVIGIGAIAPPEIRILRVRLHTELRMMWENKKNPKLQRERIYKVLEAHLQRPLRISEVNSTHDCTQVLQAIEIVKIHLAKKKKKTV